MSTVISTFKNAEIFQQKRQILVKTKTAARILVTYTAHKEN
jgi:hypothetical protein